ncbi:hypothetical protein [Chitinophaga japonensis]|uniref:Uncharacterized protein n=1 Tax=Chitinophaga japonensis TaxID=104662 RepID=A0A562T1X7_CHIJA|nr:hypothetical protein [Chitinophaga japonensis]TWI86820.1 hypothetical protein LX66_4084 [Chitinophaga japonensis]
MKSITSILSMTLLATFLLVSCSKDTDPADTDIFTGTFKGEIGYTDGETNISQENGSVFVTKVGSRYDFRFSDNIPDLTGVEFEQKDDNTMVNIGASGTGVITINKDNLNIAFSRDGQTWSADCTR